MQTPFVQKYFYIFYFFIIFPASLANSLRQNRSKCCVMHDFIHIFLDNGVKTTPKRDILLFVFTVLCFKNSLFIRIMKTLTFLD